jgi:hypothetical protein
MIDAGSISVIVRPGSPLRVSLENTRPAGLFDRLAKTAGGSLRRLATMVYTLCPVAHLTVLDAAQRALGGMREDERRKLDGGFSERAVMLEALLENARVLTLDADRLAPGAKPDAALLRSLGAWRGKAAEITQALLDFEPLKRDPNAAQIASADKLISIIAADAGGFLEHAVYGMAPDRFYRTVTDRGALADWTRKTNTPAARLMAEYLSLPDAFGRIDLDALPSLGGPCVKAFAEEIFHRLRDEPGFDMAPVWRSVPALTGAVTREISHPLLASYSLEAGVNAAVLLAARLLDTASFWSRLNGRSVEGEPDVNPIVTYCTNEVLPGAAAMLETARGLLTHATGSRRDEDGVSVFHAVTSPTEWQFSPSGPGLQAVSTALKCIAHRGPQVTPDGWRRAVRLALFGLDACVPVAVGVSGLPEAVPAHPEGEALNA